MKDGSPAHMNLVRNQLKDDLVHLSVTKQQERRRMEHDAKYNRPDDVDESNMFHLPEYPRPRASRSPVGHVGRVRASRSPGGRARYGASRSPGRYPGGYPGGLGASRSPRRRAQHYPGGSIYETDFKYMNA